MFSLKGFRVYIPSATCSYSLIAYSLNSFSPPFLHVKRIRENQSPDPWWLRMIIREDTIIANKDSLAIVRVLARLSGSGR